VKFWQDHKRVRGNVKVVGVIFSTDNLMQSIANAVLIQLERKNLKITADSVLLVRGLVSSLK